MFGFLGLRKLVSVGGKRVVEFRAPGLGLELRIEIRNASLAGLYRTSGGQGTCVGTGQRFMV